MKKQYRVKKSKEIDAIIKNKVSIGDNFFVIYYKENNLNHFRFAISIGRKYGKAVLRNKIKRQIRMIISKIKFQKIDFVVVVKKQANKLTFKEIDASLHNLAKKIIKNGDI